MTPITPHTCLRLPPKLKARIQAVTDNVSGFLIESAEKELKNLGKIERKKL
jgi:hypothetical protein